MAFEMIYNLAGDYPVDAYVRIKQIRLDFDPEKAAQLGFKNHTMQPILEVKSAKEKHALDTWASEQWIFGFDEESKLTIIEQAYDALSLLPEFAGATQIED